MSTDVFESGDVIASRRSPLKVYLVTSVDNEHSYDDEEILNQGMISATLDEAKVCAASCLKYDFVFLNGDDVIVPDLTWSGNVPVWWVVSPDDRFIYQIRELALL